MLRDALALHWDTLNAAAGEPVTFVRGSFSTSLNAVVGQSTFDENGDGQVLIKAVDFIVKSSDLTVDGEQAVPRRGDYFLLGTGEIFDVMRGRDGAAWMWSDGRQTQMRIHTMRRRGVTS